MTQIPLSDSEPGKSPLLLPVACFAGGILFGHHVRPPVATCMIPSAILALTAWNLAHRNHLKGALTAVCAALFLVGSGYIVFREFRVPPSHIALSPPGEEVAVIGRLYKPPEKTQNGFRLYIDLVGIETDYSQIDPATGKIRISVTDTDPISGFPQQLSVYSWIRAETVLSFPSGYGDPGVFDPADYLALQEIFLTGNLKYTEFLTCLKPGPALHPIHLMHRLRQSCLRYIDVHCRPFFSDSWDIDGVNKQGVKELSKALLLGVRTGLEDELKQRYQQSGLYHLLAISGLHVGIIAVFLHLIFKIVPISYRMSAVAVATGIVGYWLLSGTGPSVTRAALIVFLYMSARCMYRRPNAVNLLSFAAFILLIVNPGNLFRIGFQLTFAATFGILFLTPALQRLLSIVPFTWLRSIIAISLAAQIATTPFSALYFNRVYGLAFLPYILIAPLVPIALGTGLAGMMLAPIPPLGRLFMRLHATILALMTKGAYIISELPGMTIRVVTPDMIGYALSLILLILLFWAASGDHAGKRPALRLFFPILLTVFLAGRYFSAMHQNNRSSYLDIYILDVGNADSSFIRFPSGRNILIDGGGIRDSDFDVGRRVVARTLRTLGVNKLDIIVITHPHPDHQNGVVSLLDEFPVSELWIPSRSFKNATLHALLSKAARQNISVRCLDDRSIYRHLHLNVNNRSLVLSVEYGRFRMLFPGDAEAESETGLLDYGNWLRSDILKAGHHGSRTSSTTAFLKAVQPRLITIPCGRNNRFGHPHKQALNRMLSLKRHPLILRSDANGMIHIRTDGFMVHVKSHTGPPSDTFIELVR